MRSVESVWYRNFIYNLGLTKERYDSAITRSTSGKQLNRLSDNPSDMAYVLDLRSRIGQIDQFAKNIQTGQSALAAAETAVNSSLALVYRAVTLAEQGASETNVGQSRDVIADEIEALRQSLLNYANTQQNGRYLFAGSRTTTLPFTEAGGVVAYNGNDERISVQADFSVQVETNLPGSEVFSGPVDVFQRLADLRDALQADDTDAITASISSMNEVVTQFNDALGQIGNRRTQLSQTQGLLTGFRTSLQSKMSSLEDADMARAITDLSREQVALSAMLQAGAAINQQSLMDYLG